MVVITGCSSQSLSSTSCVKCMPPKQPFSIPFEDFSFSLEWGVELDASYNSETKQLVKFTHVRERQPEDYITTYTYPNLRDVYDDVRTIDIFSYDDEFDPFKGKQHIMTTPSMQYKLTIGDKSIEIKDYPISRDMRGLTVKGKDLIELIFSITDTIESSDEWNNLPDFEYYYM